MVERCLFAGTRGSDFPLGHGEQEAVHPLVNFPKHVRRAVVHCTYVHTRLTVGLFWLIKALVVYVHIIDRRAPKGLLR